MFNKSIDQLTTADYAKAFSVGCVLAGIVGVTINYFGDKSLAKQQARHDAMMAEHEQTMRDHEDNLKRMSQI